MQTTINLIGLPNLAEVMGSETNLEWPGGTLGDMIAYLTDRHGPVVQKLLLDDQGRLDATIQVMVDANGRIPRENIQDHSINEGDAVTFVLLAAGG